MAPNPRPSSAHSSASSDLSELTKHEAVAESVTPPLQPRNEFHQRFLERIREDRSIWEKRYRGQLVEEQGYAPADHPTVVLLSQVASEVRAAANADPVLQYMGVALPEHVKVVVVFGKEPNAFVLQNEWDTIYVTTGLLEMGAPREEIVSVIAHEQGHQIFEAFLEADRAREKAAPLVRFGEKIWYPADQESVGDGKLIAYRRLSSKREELWCNTYGSFPHLNRLGIDPRNVARFEGRVAPEHEALRAIGSVGDNLRDLYGSHPKTAESLWTERLLAHSLAYPSSLVQRECSRAFSVEVPRDLVAEKFVQELERRTGFIGKILLEPFLSVVSLRSCGMGATDSSRRDPAKFYGNYIGLCRSLPVSFLGSLGFF